MQNGRKGELKLSLGKVILLFNRSVDTFRFIVTQFLCCISTDWVMKKNPFIYPVFYLFINNLFLNIYISLGPVYIAR